LFRGWVPPRARAWRIRYGIAGCDDDVRVVMQASRRLTAVVWLGQEPAPGFERPVASDAERAAFVGR